VKVLALETSSMVASVAIVSEDKMLSEFTINNKKTHSQMLMPIVEQVTESLDLALSDIDVFAVSSGPGSFTGIRIGVATTKSLAQALNKPVAGISGLDGLAFNLVNFNGIICPMMDARNAQIYTCLYRSNGEEIDRLREYMAIRVVDLISLIQESCEPVMFCGDGVLLHKNLLAEKLGDRAKFSQSVFIYQRASSIAFLALQKAKVNDLLTYNELQPYYLRKSQAEQKFGMTQKGENLIE
jgi:tRNA threonylcarbamoyladenosine biosynthesis protein TsaB